MMGDVCVAAPPKEVGVGWRASISKRRQCNAAKLRALQGGDAVHLIAVALGSCVSSGLLWSTSGCGL